MGEGLGKTSTAPSAVDALRKENGDKWLVVLGEKNDRMRRQNQLKAYSSGGGAAPTARQPQPAAPPSATLIKLIEGVLRFVSHLPPAPLDQQGMNPGGCQQGRSLLLLLATR